MKSWKRFLKQGADLSREIKYMNLESLLHDTKMVKWSTQPETCSSKTCQYVQVVNNNRWNSISVWMRIFQCSDIWKVPWFVFPLKNHSLILVLILFHDVHHHQITHDYFLNHYQIFQVCQVKSSSLHLFDLYLLKRCETLPLEKLTIFPEIPPAHVWVHLQNLQNFCTVKPENYIK